MNIPKPNSKSTTNGELWFFNRIKDKCKVIFDVGCRYNTLFRNGDYEIHYFDPVPKNIGKLKKIENNKKAYFNAFGLSDKEETIPFYLSVESFVNRSKSIREKAPKWKPGSTTNLSVKRADKYIINNKIKVIDFLKIDTEGYEYKVILGFGKLIQNVKIIQFEYGATWFDAGVKLITVINYLRKKGFNNFNYLYPEGMTTVEDLPEIHHFWTPKSKLQYCNIICYNQRGVK